MPEKILTNAELERMVATSDDWIVSRTGIRQRHIAAEGQLTSDLATHAAQSALESAQIAANEVDLIIVATTTPDHVFPSVACKVQHNLGITSQCPAFDIQAVCSGFIYAMTTAVQFISTGACKRALVIGAETMSRVTDYTDRTNCILWGDGAGAIVLEASDTPGVVSSHLHADGAYRHLLNVDAGVSNQTGKNTIYMEGNAVFKMAVNTMDAIVDETLLANDLETTAVDWLVPHQANIRILQSTAKKLGLSMDRVIVTVDTHGNTSAASIPLALDQGVRDGRICRDQMVLMEAFGGGFTWGSVLMKY